MDHSPLRAMRGGLELVDWDNNTVWSYEFNTSTWLSHHDAVYMPNGNMLVLTWELVYADEVIELGRDPDEIATGRIHVVRANY